MYNFFLGILFSVFILPQLTNLNDLITYVFAYWLDILKYKIAVVESDIKSLDEEEIEEKEIMGFSYSSEEEWLYE